MPNKKKPRNEQRRTKHGRKAYKEKKLQDSQDNPSSTMDKGLLHLHATDVGYKEYPLPAESFIDPAGFNQMFLHVREHVCPDLRFTAEAREMMENMLSKRIIRDFNLAATKEQETQTKLIKFNE